MRVPEGLRRRRSLFGIALAVLVAHLALLGFPLQPDEAGFYLVADRWSLSGGSVYGPYWVDRPPGLIALFRLATLAGDHPLTVRDLAAVFAIAFVVLAWRAAEVLGARPFWAAVVAGAGVSTPLFAAQTAVGELFALPLAMAAVVLLLTVRAAATRRLGLAALAGVSAACAVMVKQSLVTGLVFAAVLVVADLLRGTTPRRLVLERAGAFGAGGLVVVAALVGYGVVSSSGLADLWLAVVTFRGRASAVIFSHNLAGVQHRAGLLLLAFVLSGTALLLVVLLARVVRRGFRGSPVAWATGATLVVDLVAVAAGGGYWPHYLIQVLPMLCLGVAQVVPTTFPVRLVACLVVVSALFGTGAAFAGASDTSGKGTRVGRFVGRSADPGDTAVVLYGHPEVQLGSGLQSPYPYLWSLPIRTLDPHLTRLIALLRSGRAPTWVVLYDRANSFGLDRSGRLRQTLAARYRIIGRPCGATLWLRDDETRTIVGRRPCRDLPQDQRRVPRRG